MKRKETGDRGEQLARDYLKKHRHRLVETNYTCPHGEIDIISVHNKTLVFTEVRSKTGTGFGTPGESVTRTKKDHIRSSAMHFIQTHDRLPESWRIDFIGVELDKNGRILRIEHIENAIGEQ
jgi:putative endonuclease